MIGKKKIALTLWRREQPADDFAASDPVDVPVTGIVGWVEWKSGGESEVADQQKGRLAGTIGFIWGPSIAAIDSNWWATRENQLTNETERFNFLSVVNVDDRNREVVIEAVRGVNGGR